MKLLALMAAAFALGGCTTVLLPPNVTPVVARTSSVADAQRKLDKVKAERAAVEADYAASEQVCYAKFFVNNCLDTAKEKRRSALALLRAIEVEAELFQRKAAVEQRDREVAQAIREFEAGEARLAAIPPPPPVAAEPKASAPRPALAGRNAQRASKQTQRAAQAPQDAAERAANVAEFEKRKRESEQRQKKVAAKKAEKAAKAAQPPAK